MQTAVAEHLRELARVAGQLADVIDHEDPGRPLPTIALCRAAVTADEALAKLRSHLEVLARPAARDTELPFAVRK